ncbi:F-box/LRR-repeat protein 2-like [Oscarella lobularis]|uniref:F-box/LRR-repeat protein 2-like n=1 Tax=Oscarella lobularis TaxID=121494 RepID=UPI0033138C3E
MNVSAAEMSRRAALKKITNEDLENDESPFSLQLSDDSDVPLNDDVLLSIFSYLDIREIICLERVCKRWRSLALCLWKSKSRLNFRNSFSLSQGVLTDKIFDSIVVKRGCRGLKILDLSSCSRCLTDYCLLVIGNTCKSLEELDLSGVSVTVQSVKFLVENCKKLEVVRLRRCFSAGEKCLWWIFRRCPNLRVIDFEGCMKFTGKCFFVAGPNLTTVLLSQCHKVTDDAFQFLNRAGCALTRVDVSGCVQLTDSAAREIVKFPLTHLKMSNCPKVRFIELKRLPNLVELNVSRNDAVDDCWLSVIAFYCRLLRTLDVSQCRNVTDDGVKCLSNCFLLESLNISLVTSLTDASCIELACLESLRTLSAKHCHFLTSASLSRIVSECTRLENLNVSGCDSIGDRLVDSLLARTSAATTPHKLEVTVSEMSFSERGRKELERLAERSSGLEVFFVTSARDNEEIFSDFDSEEEELSDEPENYYAGGDHLIDNDDYYEFLTNDDPLETEMLS